MDRFQLAQLRRAYEWEVLAARARSDLGALRESARAALTERSSALPTGFKMDAESRSAALRALERASVKRPDASLISGCCQFYVQKKAEGLNAQQAELALYRMLKFGDDDSKASSSAPPPRAAPAAGAAPAAPATGAAPQPKEDDADAVDEAIEAEVFAAYAAPPLPASLANARVHPGEISESVLLASVAAPSLVDVDPGAALEACANSGALSALQLEGALRAARRHAVVANGVRAGFFLGDGAGQRANRIHFPRSADGMIDRFARRRGRRQGPPARRVHPGRRRARPRPAPLVLGRHRFAGGRGAGPPGGVVPHSRPRRLPRPRRVTKEGLWRADAQERGPLRDLRDVGLGRHDEEAVAPRPTGRVVRRPQLRRLRHLRRSAP